MASFRLGPLATLKLGEAAAVSVHEAEPLVILLVPASSAPGYPKPLCSGEWNNPYGEARKQARGARPPAPTKAGERNYKLRFDFANDHPYLRDDRAGEEISYFPLWRFIGEFGISFEVWPSPAQPC